MRGGSSGPLLRSSNIPAMKKQFSLDYETKMYEYEGKDDWSQRKSTVFRKTVEAFCSLVDHMAVFLYIKGLGTITSNSTFQPTHLLLILPISLV